MASRPQAQLLSKTTVCNLHYVAENDNISFCYRYMLDDGHWGDSIVLLMLSHMWGITITVLNASSLTETRLRHNKAMTHVDIVLVFNGIDHYSPASKCKFFKRYAFGTFIFDEVRSYLLLVCSYTNQYVPIQFAP